MISLESKVALITGASGAIGQEIATTLAAEGVDLLLTGRDRERLSAAVGRCLEHGVTAEGIPASLAQRKGVGALARRVEERFGGVDLLIHCAAVFKGGEVAEAPMEDLDLMMAVNLRAPFELTQRLLPGIRERQGQIVFVNSTAGRQAFGGFAGYCASKFALTALADSLRDEVNPHGVRVLTVFPGKTDSAMQVDVQAFMGNEDYDPSRYMTPADVAGPVVHALKLPLTAEVTDLAVRPMKG